MQKIDEGRLAFSFPNNTLATKYDGWAFYRNQFNSAFGGTKAIDLIHVDSDQTWLIEIKDYRVNRRTKAIEIGDEVALKVRDTLAGLVAAKCMANDSYEKNAAVRALEKNRIRVVLHLEQPLKHSKLFPKVFDPSKVLQKLKHLLKAVDAHPRVVDQLTLDNWHDMNWQVKG